MRVGIMQMQMENLLPAGGSQEAILSALSTISHRKLIAPLVKGGFRLIELGGDLLLFFPHLFSPAAMDDLAQYQAQENLSFTVHLPLWSVEPSTPLSAVREGSLNALMQAVKAFEPLRPECYVLHATGALAAEFYQMRLPESGKAIILRQFQQAAMATIRGLLAETGIASRRLAIETIEFPFDLTLEMAESLDLGICLDTGHVLVGFSGPISLETALDRAAHRLAEIHLHDGPWQGPQRSIGYGKDHQPLGTGDLPAAWFVDRLTGMDFKGPIIFELALNQALDSMRFLQSIRPDQFSLEEAR